MRIQRADAEDIRLARALYEARDCSGVAGTDCIDDDYLRDDNGVPLFFDSPDEAAEFARDWIDDAPFDYEVKPC